MKCYYANGAFNEQCQYSLERFLMIYLVCPTLFNTKTTQEMKMPSKHYFGGILFLSLFEQKLRLHLKVFSQQFRALVFT